MKYGPSIVTNGCVLALDAADRNSYPGSGNTWYDLSGNGNHAALNGPVFATNNYGTIYFDGVNDYGTFNDISQTGGFTASFWFKNTATDQDNANTMLLGSSYDGQKIGSYLGKYFFRVGGAYGYYGALIEYDVFNNLVVVRTTDGYLQYYINNELINSVLHNSGEVLFNYLGRVNSAQFFEGYIGNLYIYNRALSDSEILHNYNNTKSRFGL